MLTVNRLFLRLVTLTCALLFVTGCTAGPSVAAINAAQPTVQHSTTPRPIRLVTPIPARPAPAQPTVPPTPSAPTVYTYRVVASYPHDPDAFTQGLVYVGNDRFYEGTGNYGESTLREVNLNDGSIAPNRFVRLEPHYFGEGIAVVDGRIFQLTWRECTGFIYDEASFAQIGTFDYSEPDGSCVREGWGLTYDGERLIMSDGTPTLTFLDPAGLAEGRFEVIGSVTVRDGSTPIVNLNELEYINGEVFANIWQTDRIARIDPATGVVTGWIDLSGLKPEVSGARIDVLNGIAYDSERNRLFVTGKWWPTLFEIELVAPTVNLPLVGAG
jgi:glutaminyl-peptide cyclotransferase